MNRVIKFRGYSDKVNKWIYGSYFNYYDINSYEDTKNKYEIFSEDTNTYYRVEKDSVGQFTGFVDNKNNEIYEGDIVAYVDPSDNYYEYCDVLFDQESGSWIAKGVVTVFRLSDIYNKCKIAGNQLQGIITKDEEIEKYKKSVLRTCIRFNKSTGEWSRGIA